MVNIFSFGKKHRRLHSLFLAGSDLEKMQAPYPQGPLIRLKDKELLHLLVVKLHGYDDPRIPVINVNDFEPWELPELLNVNSHDREWYFFRYRQEPNNRTTRAGYYKVTGKGSKIKNTKEEIGTKTILVYYKGRTPNGVKTSWKMHEIHATCLPDHQRSIILCKLIDRSDDEGYLTTYTQGEHGYFMADSDFNQMANNASPDAGEAIWCVNSENQADGIPQQEGPELPPYPESLQEGPELSPYPESFHGWPVTAAEEQGLFYDNFGTHMFSNQAYQFNGNFTY